MNWLQMLNPKTWVIKVLKALAIKEIQKEGDILQERLKREIEEGGLDRLHAVLDSTQRRLTAAIDTQGPTWSWLGPVRAQIHQIIDAHLDDLQEKLCYEIKAQGPKAIDLVFDKAQDLLIAKISAL